MAETTNRVSSFSKLALKYNGLKQNERRLIFYASPALVLFLGVMLFIEPAITQFNKIQTQIERAENQRKSLDDTRFELYAEAKKDPDEASKLNIEKLEKRLFALEKEFQMELGQLVSPQAMPVLLEQLFDKADSLTLLKMESIAPQSLFSKQNSDKQLFQHGIRITFEGDYLDTRDFLANAEDIGWKLYWKHLQYDVQEHPNATTQLEVFTLSTSEAFIGVN